jgi:hypothetical protein
MQKYTTIWLYYNDIRYAEHMKCDTVAGLQIYIACAYTLVSEWYHVELPMVSMYFPVLGPFMCAVPLDIFLAQHLSKQRYQT